MQRVLLFISFVLLISCSKEKTPYQYLQGNAFGTTFNISYQDALNRDFTKQIDSLIYEMNNSLSTYMPSSIISKINSGNKNIKVDTLFKEVFEKSYRIYAETEGYFDPTVGVLVNAWGFGPEEPIKNVDSARVKELLEFVGFDKVVLREDRIVKHSSRIYFDFNAIAKGYGIDIIGRFLESKNCTNYLVELGGEVRVRGVNSKGSFWTVAIEDPNTDGTRSYSTVVTLNNQSMASSGNYRKYKVDENGRKFVHTVNPITGYATESDLLAVTVIAGIDCANVDGYATAFMAMGFEKTMDFLNWRIDLKAHLIYVDANGETQTFTSEGLLITNR